MKLKKLLLFTIITATILTGGYYANALFNIGNVSKPAVRVSSLQKGLVLHQPLDIESLKSATVFGDKTPYENNGQSANTPVFTTDHMGQANRAMTFNGVNDYVDLGNDSSLDITDEITISAWVITNYPAQGDKRIIDKTTVATANSYLLDLYNGTRMIIAPNTLTVGENIPANEWINIVVSYSSSSGIQRIYWNNVLKAEATGFSGSIATNSNAVKIGCATNLSSYFNGSIADVRIYNRALSQEEITQLYETYRPKLSAGSLQKGLVLHQPLDIESLKSATVFGDKTPYGNDGTSANTPVFTTDRMGQANRAMSFNGVDDYVDCGNNSSLDLIGDLTFLAWIKTNNNRAGIITHSWGSYGLGFGIGNNNTDGRLGFYTSTQGNWIEAGNDLSDNIWHQVAVSLNGTEVKLFTDGNYIGGGIGSPASGLSGDLQIGTFSSVFIFNGSLADVRIYNRALSQEEITKLYETYRPKLSAGSLQKGLVLDMPLTKKYTKDETVGSEIMTDRTPNSNDGQNSGATVGSEYTSFDGVNDFVDCGNDESLDLDGNSFTVSMWLKSNADVNNYISKGHCVINKYLHFGRMNTGKVIFGFYGEDLVGATTLNLHEWYHLVGTYDTITNDKKIFLDGVIDGQKITVDLVGSNAYPLEIGRMSFPHIPKTCHLNGSVADVRIYNRVLSQEEITQLYEKGKYE